jgi:hypothetical protein
MGQVVEMGAGWSWDRAESFLVVQVFSAAARESMVSFWFG